MLSDPCLMGAGCPQGAILSHLLFHIMLSDLPVDDAVRVLSYADDITLVLTGKDEHELQNSMQLQITRVVDWLGMWGLNVNPSKSSVQWFSRKRGVDMSIQINDIISCVQEQRLLGVILDMPLLTWQQHIQYNIADGYWRVNLMKSFSRSEFHRRFFGYSMWPIFDQKWNMLR